MGSRILVTGSSGFIGSAVAASLEARGDSVVPFDLRTGQDVLDAGQLRRAIERVDAVVHLAAPSSIVDFSAAPVESRRTTIEGTRNILAFFKGRVIVPSTAGVYASAQHAAREDDPLAPVNAYAATKLEVEQICASANANGGDVKVLRIFTGYGPAEWRKGPAASPVMHFLAALRAGARPEVFGDGSQRRDCVYIDDIAVAVMRALDVFTDQTTFNVGTGIGSALRDVAAELNRQLGTGLQPRLIQPRFPAAWLLVADTTKAKAVLGFEARVSLSEGIRRMINAYDEVLPAQATRR